MTKCSSGYAPAVDSPEGAGAPEARIEITPEMIKTAVRAGRPLIIELAKALYWKMEHLDPNDDFDWNKSIDENWLALNEHDRVFYIVCVDAVLAALAIRDQS
jgi:hypothetical protein